MSLTITEKTNVNTLVASMFNAASGGYYGSIASSFENMSKDYGALATALGQSSAFINQFSSLTNNDAVATKMLENFGMSKDGIAGSAAYNYFMNCLHANQSKATIMLNAAAYLIDDSVRDAIFDTAAAILHNKAAVANGYTGADTDVASLKSIFNTVGSNSADVATAIAVANGINSGRLSDGYISGGTVFADANGDGIWNAGEAKTTTDANGNFTLTGAKGSIVASGGTDISTGLTFTGSFTAPAGSTTISPLTTLIHEVMQSSGTTAAAAAATVAQALGLSANANLLTFDPIAAASSTTLSAEAKAAAINIQSAAVQVNNMIAQAASTLSGAGTGSVAASSTAAAQALAQMIVSSAATATKIVDLTSATTVQSFLNASATQAGATTEQVAKVAAVASSVATSTANINTVMQTAVTGAAAGTSATDIFASLAKTQVAANDIAALAHTAASTGTTTALTAASGTSTINTAAAAATVPGTPPAGGGGGGGDITAPTATLTYSTDGGTTYTSTLSTKDADTLKIKATFSEAIADGTGATITINNSILSATTMTKVSTTIYTYDLNVPAGNIATATVSIGLAADAAGNVISATPTNATFTIDNTAPASLATITLDLATASDTGTSSTDDLTSNTTPEITVSTLNGVLMAAGDIIKIVDTSNANAVVGSYTVLTGDLTTGAWNGTTKAITLSILATGAHALKVQLVDAAGNAGTISTTATTVTIDTTVPTASVTTATIANTANATVQSSEVGTAYLVKSTLTVPTTAAELIALNIANDTSVNTVSITAANTNTSLAATGLIDGTYKVYTVDAAGNLSTASTNSVTVDTTAPTAPTGVAVTSVGGTVVANTMNATNTHLTALATITAGEATGGSAVLKVNGTTVATDATILSGDTTVTFTTSDGTPTAAKLQTAIAAGGTVTVTVTDLAGNTATSSVSNPTLVRDIVAPAAHASPISGNDMGGVTGYGEGDLITLTFSEAVDVSTVIAGNLAINNTHSLGTSPTITPISPASGYASSFRIQLGAGASVAAADTITITAANVVDAAGNAASGSVVFTVPAITAPISHRATTGTDSITGTAANDVFIAVGVTAAGQYSGADANFADLTTINSNATSEINSSDTFDGGGGYNVLHVYGTTDLTGVTLTNIQKVVLHSDVTFSDTQMSALNTAGATIVGDGASTMRLSGTSGSTVNMSNIQLQAIGQFDLAQSLTAQISQLGLDQIGTVAAKDGAFLQASSGTLDFSGKTVYGLGSIKDSGGTLVSTLDAVATGVGVHLNTVVTSVASLVTSMNTALSTVPGYITQDAVHLDVASMSLFLGSQTAADVIQAGSNHAFLRGGSFNDTIIGGSGTNFISGAAGDDTITGGALRDFISGDEGNDTIYGLGGNDFINSQGGDDIIYGGAGQDFIMPGDGADTVIVDNDPDFISLYSSTTPSAVDGSIDTVKFVNDIAVSGTNVIVGFDTTKDILKFESTATGTGITGMSAAAGNATINAATITGFNMNTTAPGGILILTDSSFIRGDAASANNGTTGYDATVGVIAGAGKGHFIAVDDGSHGSGNPSWNTNIFYDNDGSTTANNWVLAVKLIGVAVTDLSATSLQLVNEL